MSTISKKLQLYDILNEKLGNEAAKLYVEVIDEEIEAKFKQRETSLSTKEDMAKMEGVFKTDLAKLETALTNKIYIAGLIQILAVVGSIFALSKYVI